MKKYSLTALGTLVVILTLGVSIPAAVARTVSAHNYYLSAGRSWSIFSDPHHRNFTETFTLQSGNSRTVYIRRVGSAGPGLQLLNTPAQQSDIETILPHKSVRLVVSYHVSNCALVPKGSWPLTMSFAWRITGTWHRISLQMESDSSTPWPRFETASLCK